MDHSFDSSPFQFRDCGDSASARVHLRHTWHTLLPGHSMYVHAAAHLLHLQPQHGTLPLRTLLRTFHYSTVKVTWGTREDPCPQEKNDLTKVQKNQHLDLIETGAGNDVQMLE